MGTPFKMKGMSFGNSPVKQTTLQERALQSKIATEYKLPVSKKGSMPKGFNVTGSSKAGKLIKWAGKKALGVLGFMGAGTLSASAGDISKKSEGEQIKNLLTKHKLKGGN